MRKNFILIFILSIMYPNKWIFFVFFCFLNDKYYQQACNHSCPKYKGVCCHRNIETEFYWKFKFLYQQWFKQVLAVAISEMPSSEPTLTPTPTPTKTPTLTPTGEPTTRPSITPTGFQPVLAFFVLYFKMLCTSTKENLAVCFFLLLKQFIGIADFC